MSKFYLLNTVIVGTVKFLAGSHIDDTIHDATGIENEGGVLWDETDADVAAAAVICSGLRNRGVDESILNSVMLAAAVSAGEAVTAADLASNAAGKGASLIGIQDAGTHFAVDNVEAALAQLGAGTAGSGLGVVLASLNITQAAVAGLGASTTGHLDFAGALPAGARFLGAVMKVTTEFQNAGDTATIDSDLGDGTTADLYIGDADLHTTGEKFAGDATAKQFQDAGGVTPRVSFTASVNLSTITAGAAVAKLFYVILP